MFGNRFFKFMFEIVCWMHFDISIAWEYYEINLESNFKIHLIPETLKVSNLSNLNKLDTVNIEIDQNTIAIVDTVKRTLAAKKS